MSLTNPDKVITEERLSQFYGSILPYLGGMPEAIANKFSKGDLYSTDEKMIGQWTDGKPLYQKTITGSGSAELPLNIDIDNAVSISGFLIQPGAGGVTTYMPLFFKDTGSSNIAAYFYCLDGAWSIKFSNSAAYNSLTYYITIQYTKTTDSAISIGSDTDYSATEKIVGTWIDGKPIYQKTVDCGALPNTTSKNVAHGISNLGDVVNIVGCAINDTSNLYVVLPITSDNDARSQCVLYVYGSDIVLEARNNNWSSYNRSYVTLQYTKTTD